MNDNLKRLISRTRYYQKKKAIILNRNRDIQRTRLIYSHTGDMDDKIQQYSILFNSCRIEDYIHNGFVYFIDENISVINNNVVIDNSPIDYDLAVNYGIRGLVERYKNNRVGSYDIKFLDSVELFISRITSAIEKDQNLGIEEKKIHVTAFTNMMNSPAFNLHEALQRILFWNQILWQTGHYLNGMGRLDVILDRFCIDGNSKAEITGFLKTLHLYYKYKSRTLIGDIGQIIILGGCDRDGKYFENEYTRLFIKTLDELHIPDPKILLRVSKHTTDSLFGMSFHSIGTGVGSPLFSNDEIIIPCLIDFGYDIKDARNYGVSACWEPLAIGNSLEQNNLTNIEFAKVLVETVKDEKFLTIDSFEKLIELYLSHLKDHLKGLLAFLNSVNFEEDPIYTLFSIPCLESNKTISEGGSKYNNYGILSVGMASAIDSLCNIKLFVFENKKYTLDRLREILMSNFDNAGSMIRNLKENPIHFGADNEVAIDLTNKIIKEASYILSLYRNKYNGRVKFGLSSPGYIDCGKNTGATLDGRKSGEPFSTHISGRYGDAVTSLFNFSSGLYYSGIFCNGNVIDTFLDKKIINENCDKLTSLIKNSIVKGIFQCQFNVVTHDELVDAKNNPEKHRDLIVRVWGFSAYFNDLPIEYKDVLIERARMTS